MHIKVNVVVVEVVLHPFAIDVEGVCVHDGQASSPFLVAICQIVSGGVEDIVDEIKVVFDLLVAFDVEAVWSFSDSRFEIRHRYEREWATLYKPQWI